MPQDYDNRFIKKTQLANLKMRICNLHGQGSKDEILDLIKTQNDFRMLIKLIDDPTIRQYLYHDKLQQFWDEQLQDGESLGEKLGLEYDYHGLQPHPIIPSLHLIIGYYFYDKACRIKEQCEKKNMFLLKAEEYGCFNAILKLNNDQEYTSSQMLPRMERLAKLHATPGFIHLAKACLHMGNHRKRTIEGNLAAASYEVALQHLYTTKKLLLYSSEIINNAYFGQGLAASNELKIDNIDTAIELILNTYPLSLDRDTIGRAQHAANLVADALIPIFAKRSSQSEINQHLARCRLAHYEQQQPILQSGLSII